MVFVKLGGSPAVGPRVGLVPAADVLLFDGNPPGGACGRVSRRTCMESATATPSWWSELQGGLPITDTF